MAKEGRDSNRVAVSICTDYKDDILMGQRLDNFKITTPGGHIKEGECPFVGMIREFQEETGVNPESIKLVGANYIKEKNIFIYLFEVRLPKHYEFDASQDPDKEVSFWKFTDPNNVVCNLHVPVEDNVVLKYWIDN